MRRKNTQHLTGKSLLEDFQTVFVSMATIEAAQHEAERSESAVMAYLSTVNSGLYLNPNAISENSQVNAARASLDAHIKKVQVQQMTSMNAQQLQSLIDQDRSSYIGRKVRVSVTSLEIMPIVSVWFDINNGYRDNQTRKRSVVGTVEEVLLDKNVLVLKPTSGMRFLYTNLQNYIVYIINPETLAPMVDIAII